MNTKTKRTMVIGFAIIAVVVMILALTGLIEETLGVTIALAMTVIFSLIVATMAHKLEINILTVLMSVFAVIGLILLGVNLVTLFNRDEDVAKAKFTIKATEDASEKKAIFSHDGKDYYTYHLSDVEITMNSGEKYSLEKAISGNHLTLNDILSYTIPNANTDGYKIYYDGGENSFDKYSVVVCDAGDVIFADYDYTYDDSICND